MSIVCVDKVERGRGAPGASGGGIVTLETLPGALPAWVEAGAVLRVPIPPGPADPLEAAETLVWGRLDDGRSMPLVAREADGVRLAFPLAEWSSEVLTDAYAVWRRQPLHTRLPVSYRIVPAGMRRRIALRAQERRARSARGGSLFPAPPFDSGFEALRAMVRRFTAADRSDGPRPRICLTHDVESSEGFGFVKRIAEIEMAHGLRSSWNIVAKGYAIDYATLDWLVENGFEIGLHGYCHDNRLIYLSESDMRRRLDGCVPLIERYGIRGFRSPSWLRSARLMGVLSDYLDYDCSTLDFDWYCPAGPGGVLTATPFKTLGLVEIPTTLPLEALIAGLSSPAQRRATWRRKIDWIRAVGGQAVVMTHPDPLFSGNQEMIGVYGEFLNDLIAVLGSAWSLPRALSEEVRGDA